MIRRRRGMILYLVFMIAVVIGVFVGIVHHHRASTRRQMGGIREKMQAQFVAQGAQQHFLLKMKLLAAPLYEATGFAVGRNPYYDFGAYVSGTDGTRVFPLDEAITGPLFFTGSGRTTLAAVPVSGDPQAPPGAKVLVVDRGDEATAGGGLGIYAGPAFPPGATGVENAHVMRFLLEHYLLDVTSDYPRSSSIIRIQSGASYPDQAAMGSSSPGPVAWRDPFSANYYVEDCRLLGMGGAGSRAGKKYEADSLQLTTEAQVRVDSQISCVTAVNGAPRKLSTPVALVEARLSGDDGNWLGIDVVAETAAQRDARAGSSVRRTEVVTATYLVRRPR